MKLRRECLTIYTLWLREVVRFYRQPARVMGALGTPLIFWVFIGSGFGSSFQAVTEGGKSSSHYLYYFFPGTVLLILLFTSIFSTFSLIQDRQSGFLQGVLVSPASRLSLMLGLMAGGATLAFVQALLFLIFIPALGFSLSYSAWGSLLGALALNSFALTAFGFLMAWKINSVQGFHSIMNLLLMPLWFLSGALFPPSGAPGWIQWAMKANPLHYGLAALREPLYTNEASAYWPSYAASLLVVLMFGFVCLLASVIAAREKSYSE